MRQAPSYGRRKGDAILERLSRPLRSEASLWMQAYAYCAIAFFSGALHRPLSAISSSDAGDSESPVIQIVGSLIILIAGVITGKQLILRPRTQAVYPTTIGLILSIFCAWVLMSIVWSADPALSFRRGVAFVGTVLVSWTLATTIPRDELLRLLGRAAIVFIAVSAVLGATSYSYAFHQAGELGNPAHEGLMRGSFSHKNEFARIVALAMLLTIGVGQSSFGRIWPAAVALICGAAMLVLAGSAKVMIALPIAVLGGIMLLFCNTLLQRLAVLIFVGIPAGLLWWSGQFDSWITQLFSELGRGDDMSGRDVMWAAAERGISDHLLMGQGYAAGWAAGPQTERPGWVSVGHAHNGYLQTLLDIGLVGLILALAPLVYVLWDIILPRPNSSRIREYLSASFVTFFLIMNISGSYLINYNDIFTLLLVCVALWISQERRNFRLFLKRRRLAQMAKRAAIRSADERELIGHAGRVSP